MGLQVYDLRIPNIQEAQIADTDGTNLIYLFYTPTQPGSIVKHILVSSTSLTPHDVLLKYGSSPGALVAIVSVPAGAGQTSTVPPVDLLAGLQAASMTLVLPCQGTLYWQVSVALSTGESMHAYVDGADF